VRRLAVSYQGNLLGFNDSECAEQGISLKKCDLPESSYGTFEVAAVLNAGSCDVGSRTISSRFLRLKQPNPSV
jgi:hypothetical protein